MKLDSKYFDRIRTRRRREPEPEQAPPTCQWDGCDKGYASRSGRAQCGRAVLLFCFEHVKDYNKGYNYFSGLSDGEIARYQKEAITGHRPTWTVGVNKAAKNSPLQSEVRSGAYTRVRDPFGFVKDGDGRGSGPRFPEQRKLKTLEAKAFDTMGLGANATSTEIKSRYKELVKNIIRTPMAATAARRSASRAVIQAYQLLKQNGFVNSCPCSPSSIRYGPNRLRPWATAAGCAIGWLHLGRLSGCGVSCPGLCSRMLASDHFIASRFRFSPGEVSPMFRPDGCGQ